MSLETLLYIVIGIGLVIYRQYQKSKNYKKNEVPKNPEPQYEQASETKNIEDAYTLEELLGFTEKKNIAPEKDLIVQNSPQKNEKKKETQLFTQSPIQAHRHNVEQEPKTVETQIDSLQSYYEERNKRFSEDIRSEEKGKQTLKKTTPAKDSSKEQNEKYDEIDDFDLRKAVIYTEIMNRKYA